MNETIPFFLIISVEAFRHRTQLFFATQAYFLVTLEVKLEFHLLDCFGIPQKWKVLHYKSWNKIYFAEAVGLFITPPFNIHSGSLFPSQIRACTLVDTSKDLYKFSSKYELMSNTEKWIFGQYKANFQPLTKAVLYRIPQLCY